MYISLFDALHNKDIKKRIFDLDSYVVDAPIMLLASFLLVLIGYSIYCAFKDSLTFTSFNKSIYVFLGFFVYILFIIDDIKSKYSDFKHEYSKEFEIMPRLTRFILFNGLDVFEGLESFDNILDKTFYNIPQNDLIISFVKENSIQITSNIFLCKGDNKKDYYFVVLKDGKLNSIICINLKEELVKDDEYDEFHFTLKEFEVTKIEWDLKNFNMTTLNKNEATYLLSAIDNNIDFTQVWINDNKLLEEVSENLNDCDIEDFDKKTLDGYIISIMEEFPDIPYDEDDE